MNGRRLDQWLWFARLVKSRSLASRLCVAGMIAINDMAVGRASQIVRIGDVIVVPQGAFRRTIRVVALGTRRGPAAEAHRLYDEAAAPVRLSELAPAWAPLLSEDEPPSEVFGQR